MIRFSASGNTDRTDAFLDAMIRGDQYDNIDKFAEEGVNALRAATPRETGETADSWTYEVDRSGGGVTIWWINTHDVGGFNVAIGLQYGHGTGTGGWVQGYDYINPALKPVFDRIANGVWEEVQKA